MSYPKQDKARHKELEEALRVLKKQGEKKDSDE